MSTATAAAPRAGPEPHHHPHDADRVRHRRRARRGHLRAGRRGGRGGRRRDLGLVPARRRARAVHGLLLRRARHEVPAGGGRGALRAPRVQVGLLHLRGRVRGHGLRRHLRGDARDRLRRRLPERVRRPPDRARRARVRDGHLAHQLPRHQGVGRHQPRADRDRAGRPAARHRDRGRVPARRRRRPRPRARVQVRRVGPARDPRRRVARLLRADRLRGLRQRRRGDQGPLARLPARAVPRARGRGDRLHARDRDRLDGGPDRQARRLGRPAARGRRPWGRSPCRPRSSPRSRCSRSPTAR